MTSCPHELCDVIDFKYLYFSVVHVRETRLTTLISHLLIAVSMLMLPTPLNYIPIAVLYGKFAQTTFPKISILNLVISCSISCF